jgi:hypothetical protein
MTPLFPAQRAAEEFETVLGGTATEAVADRYAELLGAVEMLRAQPELVPRAEFVGDLRSRLMTAAETELVPAPVVRRLEPTRTSKHKRRLGTVAASLVIVGGSAGMAAAASGALPGEPLYPIKRGIEQVGTTARLSEASRGGALLDQAATRLAEVRDLQAQGAADPDLVASTMDSFRAAADEGSAKLFTAYQTDGDTQDIVTVREFTSKQMSDIVAMSAVKNARVDSLLRDAADVVADIDQQAVALCGSCGSGTVLQPPAALSAGTGARTINNLLAKPVVQAQTDIDQAEAARIANLKSVASAAEKEATEIPKSDGAPTGTIASGVPAPGEDGAVSSVITSDGKVLPSTNTGAAVNDLVVGVTGALTGGSGAGGGSLLPKTNTPLDNALDDLNDTVNKATEGLLPDDQ